LPLYAPRLMRSRHMFMRMRDMRFIAICLIAYAPRIYR